MLRNTVGLQIVEFDPPRQACEITCLSLAVSIRRITFYIILEGQQPSTSLCRAISTQYYVSVIVNASGKRRTNQGGDEARY